MDDRVHPIRFRDHDRKCGKKEFFVIEEAVFGLNNAGHPLLVLYFRVKFYVDSHLLIRDRVTRQHYYYQLRENVLRHGQPATEESFFRLAALALQAELGDYDPERHRAAYFDTQLYFPQWILERVGVDYVVQNMPAMHRDHRCLSTGSAQLLYIKEASSGHTHYGLHLYRLRSSKKSDDHNQQQLQLRTPLDRTASQRPCSANENPTIQQQLHDQPHTGTVWLGICGRGIDIYEEEDSFTKTVRATFQWPNIGKLCFERKKFEIRAVGCPESRKFTYYTSSDDKSKHLLYLCRVTHQFSMAMQPKLAELRKLEEEGN
ncbi:hypothetical protein DAPPUDRAFT_318159 [Daphnia pulex]|uniref:FERM domain-containing protein n=1 Tax=Daphnia pulex TaxID=6669 RepID=E9GI19_DAPPU|nr:hypothetical protein DAPPUDRAFT_318159 [Daphnia pulex]|eukprot:EFX80952.1 hypothetical protein DAPPUDRAFT_318159 [Daphnia pulex]